MRADTALYTQVTLTGLLETYPKGELDVIWAPWDEFAKGAARALTEQERTDVRLYGVDLSNVDLKMLQNPKNPWVSSAGTDPSALGRTQVRMLAYAMLGRPLPAHYNLTPVRVDKAMLPPDKTVTMNNLHRFVPEWGRSEAFPLTPEEMAAEKAH